MTFNLLNAAPKASLFMVDTTLKASKVGTWRSYPKTKEDMHAVCKPVLYIRTTTQQNSNTTKTRIFSETCQWLCIFFLDNGLKK